MRTPEQIADDLIAAVTQGDMALAEELYAPDAVLWQNTTAQTVDVQRALKTIAWLYKTIQNLAYEDVQRQVWDTGFIQQHRMTGTTPAGKDLTVHACMIATVRDGKLVEVREYMDSRAFDVMREDN